MTNTTVTPAAMADAIEAATNGPEFKAGKLDAVVHVGWLTTGTKTPEDIARVQEMLHDDTMDPDYIRGYWASWNALHAMLTA